MTSMTQLLLAFTFKSRMRSYACRVRTSLIRCNWLATRCVTRLQNTVHWRLLARGEQRDDDNICPPSLGLFFICRICCLNFTTLCSVESRELRGKGVQTKSQRTLDPILYTWTALERSVLIQPLRLSWYYSRCRIACSEASKTKKDIFHSGPSCS